MSRPETFGAWLTRIEAAGNVAIVVGPNGPERASGPWETAIDWVNDQLIRAIPSWLWVVLDRSDAAERVTSAFWDDDNAVAELLSRHGCHVVAVPEHGAHTPTGAIAPIGTVVDRWIP